MTKSEKAKQLKLQLENLTGKRVRLIESLEVVIPPIYRQREQAMKAEVINLTKQLNIMDAMLDEMQSLPSKLIPTFTKFHLPTPLKSTYGPTTARLGGGYSPEIGDLIISFKEDLTEWMQTYRKTTEQELGQVINKGCKHLAFETMGVRGKQLIIRMRVQL